MDKLSVSKTQLMDLDSLAKSRGWNTPSLWFRSRWFSSQEGECRDDGVLFAHLALRPLLPILP